MAPVVLHVDMDAFFAAVEERDRPELRGRPLVIGADPQGGRGRGVVCTANYAARRHGIHSALPISQAWRACPDAVFLRPDGARYREASRQVMAVLEKYADVLEVVGVDEAYLDVTGAVGGDHGFARSYAMSLQAAVARETGLSCSVGIAPSKSVAKIASDRRKPHGVTQVRPQDVEAFLEPLPVRLVHGCGPRTAQRLEEEGVLTVGELAALDAGWLEARFGAHGRWLHQVARGDDPREVRADRGPAKSRGNERTYARDERHPAHIRTTAHRLLLDLLADQDRRPFATVTLKLRYADFTTLTRAHTFAVPLDPDREDTAGVTGRIVDALLDPLLDDRPVRLVGVRLSGFGTKGGQQGLLRFGLDVPASQPVHAPARAWGIPARQTVLA